MSRVTDKLFAEWEAKLEAEGLGVIDVSRGEKLGDDNGQNTLVPLFDDDEGASVGLIWDQPRAVFYRRLDHAIHGLDRSWDAHDRAILEAWKDNNYMIPVTARTCGVRVNDVRRLVDRLRRRLDKAS